MVRTGDEMAAEAGRKSRAAPPIVCVPWRSSTCSTASPRSSTRWHDAVEISAAITAELRTIVDYHSCRVYLLQPDGRTLYPVAFRGEMFSDYEKDTVESLITEVGEGITGRVAEHRQSLITPDAREVEFAVQIPGTDDVAGVDARRAHGRRATSCGRDHAVDARLREVRRGGPATARGPRVACSGGVPERETVPGRARGGGDIDRAPAAVADADAAPHRRRHHAGGHRHDPHLVAASGSARTSATRRPETSISCGSSRRSEPACRRPVVAVPADIAASFLARGTEPFVGPARDRATGSRANSGSSARSATVLVAPLRWEPDGFVALVMGAKDDDGRSPSGTCAWPVGSPTSRRWRWVTPGVSRSWSGSTSWSRASTRSSGRPTQRRSGSRSSAAGPSELLGAHDQEWVTEGRHWGDHAIVEDRDGAIAGARVAADAGEDQNLEYRVSAPDGRTIWIRDMVHVVRASQGPRQLRGLMIDITERKRAEQALRRSERKYSEAFRREREAAQRLRALDEMKNTFLEAVSHDLRTPLTSILGSALTLEQTGLELPREDALDLVAGSRRTPASSSDCCRICSTSTGCSGHHRPQRRPTDLAELVHRAWTGPRTRRATTSRWRSSPSPCRWTPRRWSGSWRTCCRTRSATHRTARRSGCAASGRTAA